MSDDLFILFGIFLLNAFIAHDIDIVHWVIVSAFPVHLLIYEYSWYRLIAVWRIVWILYGGFSKHCAYVI